MRNSKLFQFFVLFILGVSFSGCAAKTYAPSREMSHMQGVYHRVEKGQTLWRIALIYKVGVEELARINRLPNASKIDVGQLIFIPGARQTHKITTSSKIQKSKDIFIWPLKGRIVSYYGSKKSNLTNKGIDIRAPQGKEIRASRDGRVSFCEEKVKGFGKTIIIDHRDGLSTVYAHNSEILVETGQEVRQNEVIAKVGSTGRATIPCLHFEIRKKHKPQNPLYYLP